MVTLYNLNIPVSFRVSSSLAASDSLYVPFVSCDIMDRFSIERKKRGRGEGFFLSMCHADG